MIVPHLKPVVPPRILTRGDMDRFVVGERLRVDKPTALGQVDRAEQCYKHHVRTRNGLRVLVFR
jgi:hypothetical protein